jgi:hypothetical protein
MRDVTSRSGNDERGARRRGAIATCDRDVWALRVFLGLTVNAVSTILARNDAIA